MNRGIDKTKLSLIDFTLSDTTQFYSSIVGGLGVNGLKNKKLYKEKSWSKGQSTVHKCCLCSIPLLHVVCLLNLFGSPL